MPSLDTVVKIRQQVEAEESRLKLEGVSEELIGRLKDDIRDRLSNLEFEFSARYGDRSLDEIDPDMLLEGINERFFEPNGVDDPEQRQALMTLADRLAFLNHGLESINRYGG